MSKIVLRDVAVTVNGVTLSDHASKVTITSTKNLVDATAFGARNRENLIGLGDASIDVTFFQDFDRASVDATLWPLHQAGTIFEVLVVPASGLISATNPGYRLAEAVLPNFTPLAGGVGDASTTDCTFQNAGQAGLERLTAPEGS